MLSLSWIIELNNYIFYFLSRAPPKVSSIAFLFFLYYTFRRFFMDYLQVYREMISLRGLTDHTIRSYSTYIKAYLGYLDSVLHKSPEDVSWDELRDFIRWLQAQKGLSDRTINHCISQLRFFTLYVLHRPWDATQLPMRRFDSFLPYVPSKEEVWTFISSISDLKFKAIIALMYSSGLRSGEVRHLKYSDISRKNMRIHVRSSKSRSDRYAILSSQALDILTEYWFACGRPTDWLFPSHATFVKDGSVPVSSQYLSSYIRAHEKQLGWEHRITAHTFRHAFATHLYENGTDLFAIKSLLGHKSLSSTAIYIQLSDPVRRSVQSPFDLMGGCCHE